MKKAEQAAGSAAGQARESERKRQAAEAKLADVSTSLQSVTKEREFLRSLNETLLSNQKEFQQRLQEAKQEAVAKEATIKDLQEQV